LNLSFQKSLPNLPGADFDPEKIADNLHFVEVASFVVQQQAVVADEIAVGVVVVEEVLDVAAVAPEPETVVEPDAAVVEQGPETVVVEWALGGAVVEQELALAVVVVDTVVVLWVVAQEAFVAAVVY
jgi:hypothetical protein